MKALICRGSGVVEYQSLPKPQLGENEALIKVQASGVCGSDLPRVEASKGRWEGLVLGHEMAGIVEEVRGQASSIKSGDRVVVAPLIPCFQCSHCLKGSYSLCAAYSFIGSRQDGGFAQYVKAPLANLVPIPPALDFAAASFTEPLSVAIHAIKHIKWLPGREVLITGAGTIGLLLLQVAQIYGASQVNVTDLSPFNRELARQLGAKQVWDPAQTSPAEADLVFECSGSPAAVADALQAVRGRGQVVLVGTPQAGQTWPGQLAETITRKELTIAGTWMSYSAPFPGEEWAEAVRLLEAGLVDVKPLITYEVPLEEGPQMFRMMLAKDKPYCKVLFDI